MAKLSQSRRRPSGGREPTRTFRARGSEFEVAQRYSLIKGVGKGAYGVVCSCRDTTAGSKVAIKKIIGTFDNDEDAKRTLREIKLLRLLEHHNIVNLVDLQPPASRAELDDVYEMTELMDTDLHRIIQSDQSITDEHFRYFMYQLFCALKYLHSAGVWHRVRSLAIPSPSHLALVELSAFWAGPEARQPAGEPRLRPEALRLRACAVRQQRAARRGRRCGGNAEPGGAALRCNRAAAADEPAGAKPNRLYGRGAAADGVCCHALVPRPGADPDAQPVR